jgi:uncharacterized paraquat-inducible protein A
MEQRNRYRTYTTKRVNGVKKNVLVTWVLRRCKKCQRFLNKSQEYYCDRCEREVDLERWKEKSRKAYKIIKSRNRVESMKNGA